MTEPLPPSTAALADRMSAIIQGEIRKVWENGDWIAALYMIVLSCQLILVLRALRRAARRKAEPAVQAAAAAPAERDADADTDASGTRDARPRPARAQAAPPEACDATTTDELACLAADLADDIVEAPVAPSAGDIAEALPVFPPAPAVPPETSTASPRKTPVTPFRSRRITAMAATPSHAHFVTISD